MPLLLSKALAAEMPSTPLTRFHPETIPKPCKLEAGRQEWDAREDKSLR